MPVCKNNPKRNYKGTEPSPKGLGWCASGEKIGKKRKGKDGNMWIIKKVSNGSKRWMKDSKTKTEIKTKVEKKTGLKTETKTKNNNSNNKIDCSKFVRYEKKTKGFFSNSVKILEGLKGRKGYIYKYIDFNNFEKKETKIPDGYRLVKSNKDIIKKYICNNSRQLLKKNNDEYKKIKKEMVGYKKYFTHDNGGRPYLVYIGKNDVHIYMHDDKKYYIASNDYSNDDKKNTWMYVKLVGKYKPTRIFIGKDDGTSEMSDLKGMSKKKSINFSLGNSILLELKDRYIFIGQTIYSFKTENKDKIEKYYSVIGRNDVPYPIAYGNKNVYFMLDETYIPYTKIPVLEDKKDPDAYYYYYGYANDKIKYDKFAKKMKSVKIIQKRVW